MALAQLTRTYPSTFNTIESFVAAVEQFDQLFVDAGLTYVASESTDLSILTSSALPNNSTSGLQLGVGVYRVFELNDDFSAADPIYIRILYRTFKNGPAGSPIGLSVAQVTVYPEPRVPFSSFPSYAAGTSYAVVNLSHPASLSSSSSSGMATASAAPITSTVFLDKEEGRLAVLLAPGLFGFPSASNHLGTPDTQTLAAFYLNRLKKADGSVDPDKCVVTGFHSHCTGATGSGSDAFLYLPDATISWTNFSGGIPNYKAMLPAQKVLSKVAKASAETLPAMMRWAGGAAAGIADGLPALQFGVYPSDQGLRIYPDIGMVWTGAYNGGLPKGSIFSVDNGVETYNYLNTGSLPTLESIDNNASVAWAFRLGLANG